MPNKSLNVQEIQIGKVKWINVINAKKEELEYLRKNFRFDIGDLGESLGTTFSQRAKLKLRKYYLFIIARFPYYRQDTQTLEAEEIDIFINKDTLVTAHNDKLKTLKDYFSHCKKEALTLSKDVKNPVDLFIEILNRLLNDCYTITDHISQDSKEIEDNIFNGLLKETVTDVLLMKRNIINYRRIMLVYKNLFKNLLEIKSAYFDAEKYHQQIGQLISHSKNIWENLENLKEMIEAIEHTNESLISHRLNEIMTLLTIFSVIVFPLTLLAAVFGMNTIDSMPFVKSPYGFWIIIGIMVVAVFIMYGIFKKKKWI